MALSLEEQDAIRTLRKSILVKGKGEEIIPALMKDMPQHITATAMQQCVQQLGYMLKVVRALKPAMDALSSAFEQGEERGNSKLVVQQAEGFREVQVSGVAQARSEDPGTGTASEARPD